MDILFIYIINKILSALRVIFIALLIKEFLNNIKFDDIFYLNILKLINSLNGVISCLKR